MSVELGLKLPEVEYKSQFNDRNFLGKDIVLFHGSLQVVDVMRHINGGVEKVRKIEPTQDMPFESQFVLALPHDSHADTTLREDNGQVSIVHAKDVDYIYFPQGLQVHGRVKSDQANTEFLTLGKGDIFFGGMLTRGRSDNIGMMGTFSIARLKDTSLIQLGNTGIFASVFEKA